MATGLHRSVASMIMMSMQFLGKANSMFRLWFVIGNFLCTIDSTVEVEAIGLVLLGSYNKCLPFSSTNSEAYAHSGRRPPSLRQSGSGTQKSYDKEKMLARLISMRCDSRSIDVNK